MLPMSSISNIFSMYIWIINTILESKMITLNGIARKWMDRRPRNQFVDRTTFRRYRNSIREIFGLNIKSDEMNRYYIANEEIMHDNTLNNYIFGAISQGMLFAEALSLKDRIITDPMPSAGYYLQDIIRAMNENKLVTINYQRFEDDEPKEHTLQPYFLKTFKFRWYLFGMIDNKIRTYALDRIIGMKTEEENFVMDKRITADEYFKYAFGIYVQEDVDPEEVVIEVSENESLYMETLPWHQSQQRIGVEDGKVLYKFRLNPTNDFISHIIGRQDRVKVTSPQSLVDTILDRLRAILALYV